MLIAKTLLPVMLMTLLGYLLAKRSILTKEAQSNLTGLVFNAALPALMFTSIIANNSGVLVNLKYATTYTLSVMIPFVIGLLVFSVISGKSESRSSVLMASICSALSNSGLVAMPILLLLYGNSVAIPMAIVMLTSMLIICNIFIVLLEYASSSASGWRVILSSFKNALLQPFVLASAAGFLVVAAHVKVPQELGNFVESLAVLTSPCALIAIGVSIANIKAPKIDGRILAVLVLNALVKPLIAFGVVHFARLPSMYSVSIIVIAAAPISSTVFVFAEKYRSFVEETSAAIFLTTLTSIITLPVSLALALQLWP